MFNSADCLHYLVSWLFSLSSQLIIYVIKSADYLHYQDSWLFTLSSQLIVYIITDWFDEYFRLQLLVVPAHLHWWEWDLPIPQWSKPCLILSKRLEFKKKNTKTNKGSYLMLSRFLYMYIRSGVKVNGWFYWKLG